MKKNADFTDNNDPRATLTIEHQVKTASFLNTSGNKTAASHQHIIMSSKMKMSYYGSSGSSTLNRPSKTQSKSNNSYPQQVTLPFATSIMNNLKVSKECITKRNKQPFPTNTPSSDIDLGNFSKDANESDTSKTKQKSSKNNARIIGFSWSAITNNQKDKTTMRHNKVIQQNKILFIMSILVKFLLM